MTADPGQTPSMPAEIARKIMQPLKNFSRGGGVTRAGRRRTMQRVNGCA
jgi:hypothetical protein